LESDEGTKPRPRIESLSDLVFGLALSIGAFALVSNPPRTDYEFYQDVGTFAFNFVVLISIWLRYTRIMSVLPVETRGTILLNGVLLFTVALEPFIFNILRSINSVNPPSTPLYEAASSFFGLDVGAMMLIMAVFTLTLADEENRLVPRSMLRQLREEAVTWGVAAGLFLISAIPVFGRTNVGGVVVSGLSLRFLLWILALVFSWLRSGIRETLGTPQATNRRSPLGTSLNSTLLRVRDPCGS
jgi:uncharacterized membrane protein